MKKKEVPTGLPRQLDNGTLSGPMEEVARRRAPHADRNGWASHTDLSLADARAACGGLASAMGVHAWPKLMCIGDAAALQRACISADGDSSKQLVDALHLALAAACDVGELASSRVVTEIHQNERSTGKLIKKYDDVVHHISASDFVVWLALKRETHSKHVQAWLECTTRQSGSWADVASGRRINRGGRWSNDEIQAARIEFHQRGGWQRSPDGGWQKNTQISMAMARECGLSTRNALDRYLGDGPDTGVSAIQSLARSFSR